MIADMTHGLFHLRTGNVVLSETERERILADPGFGLHFTDHMATATWTAEDGWHGHEVSARRPFMLQPASAVLHYAQEVFEGLKAYRHADGSVWLFRPELNARRLNRSARRLALPELPEEDFIHSIEALVLADRAWVPGPERERTLYLRPFMFASESFLGVRPATEVTYAVIACPSGPYFANGVNGVTLWITTSFSRSAPGGTGAAKCGGNYAASLAAQQEAYAHGCDQVLYVDGAEHRWLEESGTMNLCLVTSDGELLTPELGTILEGVTRQSVLGLAEDHHLRPVERRIGLEELRDRCADGSITEVFAAGTAAVITPIVAFKGDGYDVTVGDGRPGKTALAVREQLLDIQYGRTPDPRGWRHRIG
jgi:branched-chain amino acid aminotransferase